MLNMRETKPGPAFWVVLLRGVTAWPFVAGLMPFAIPFMPLALFGPLREPLVSPITRRDDAAPGRQRTGWNKSVNAMGERKWFWSDIATVCLSREKLDTADHRQPGGCYRDGRTDT